MMLFVDAVCSAHSRKLGIRIKKRHEEQWLVCEKKELVYMKISSKLGGEQKIICVFYIGTELGGGRDT
jgi:hypothetical protein